MSHPLMSDLKHELSGLPLLCKHRLNHNHPGGSTSERPITTCYHKNWRGKHVFLFVHVVAASLVFWQSLVCGHTHSHTLAVVFLWTVQWAGGHPQPVSEQQHRVTGGVHGVLRHEERHAVRALRTHRYLLPLLPSCEEVSHLQRSGPVQN